MKKIILLVLACIILALGASATANASHGQVVKDWYVHTNGADKLVCDRGVANSDFILTLILGGPWATKAACGAVVPGDDGSNGGGDEGNGDGGDVSTPPLAPLSTYTPPTSTYLCYSVFQTTPGDWLSPQAFELIQGGYTEAQAVAGNVEGGVNVGAYHLVCNSGLTDTGMSVGDGGSVFGADYGPADEELGFYAIFA